MSLAAHQTSVNLCIVSPQSATCPSHSRIVQQITTLHLEQQILWEAHKR